MGDFGGTGKIETLITRIPPLIMGIFQGSSNTSKKILTHAYFLLFHKLVILEEEVLMERNFLLP